MKVYRKTDTIKAEQFDGSQSSLFGYEVMPDSLLDALTGEPAYYSILIDDVESEPDDFPDDNEVSFEIGDWIVKETDEIKVIADDVFKKTYAELPVINKGIAQLIELTKQDGKSLGDMFVDYAPKQLTDADEDMISNWVHDTKNKTVLSNKLARAWLDGYVVEEEHD
ncbi:hypothetical protein A6B36_13615 [Lactiplantibacillus plantarum]|nr:hypothetical protein A6B36_13615 [Lactiplantibacillus plantarum]